MSLATGLKWIFSRVHALRSFCMLTPCSACFIIFRLISSTRASAVLQESAECGEQACIQWLEAHGAALVSPAPGVRAGLEALCQGNFPSESDELRFACLSCTVPFENA